MCASKNIHNHPKDGHNGNSKGEGNIKGQNFLKEDMKLKWNFQRGGGMQTKIPSLGGVWIFSGTTQYAFTSIQYCQDVFNSEMTRREKLFPPLSATHMLARDKTRLNKFVLIAKLCVSGLIDNNNNIICRISTNISSLFLMQV